MSRENERKDDHSARVTKAHHPLGGECVCAFCVKLPWHEPVPAPAPREPGESGQRGWWIEKWRCGCGFHHAEAMSECVACGYARPFLPSDEREFWCVEQYHYRTAGIWLARPDEAGYLKWTNDIAEARRFATKGAAEAFVRNSHDLTSLGAVAEGHMWMQGPPRRAE